MRTFALALSDGLHVARRNVIRIRRVPETLVAVLVFPLLMVVMFNYVFGSAIDVPGGYEGYLVSGAFALVLVSGSTFTGAGIAEDMQKGIMDRFRSLPMSRSAVLVGRTASDVIYNAASLVVMSLAGLAVGWRVTGGIGDAAAGFALLLGFAYAMSWIMAYVGLVVPGVEVINNVGSIIVFPLTFVSNVFVPTAGMVAPLRTIAEWNPISAVTQAARELFGNAPPAAVDPSAWPLRHPVAYTLLWTVGILAVFAPLAIRRFRRS